MKILLLHFYSAIPNPAYSQIASGLRAEGDEVVLAYRSEHDELVLEGSSEPSALAAPSHAQAGILRRKWGEIEFIWRIHRFVRTWGAEVVQLNRANLPWHWLLPLLGRGRHLYIQDCRQVESPDYRGQWIRRWRDRWRQAWHRFTIRRIYSSATYLHARGAEQELGPSWARHAAVVPLGVGASFLNSSDAYSHRTPPADMLSFLYIGSITRIRKLERLLEATAMLVQEGLTQFKLVFIGPDNTNEHYQRFAQKLGITAQVEFLPAAPYAAMPQVIQSHDIALAYVPDTPRDWQFQPTLKILEYVALGVPVIATDVAPNRDLIARLGNGLLANSDARGWAQAMRQCLTDPATLNAIRTAAQTQRGGDSWQLVACQYRQLYKRLQASARPGGTSVE